MENDIQTFFCTLKQIADLVEPENTLCQPQDMQEAKDFVAKLLILVTPAT